MSDQQKTLGEQIAEAYFGSHFDDQQQAEQFLIRLINEKIPTVKESLTTECQHHWIGDTCSRCGVAYNIAIEKERDDLKLRAEKVERERDYYLEASGELSKSLRLDLEKVERERDEARRTIAGVSENIGKCPACAEGLFCGSTSVSHKDCVYSERDTLRAELGKLKAKNLINAVARICPNCGHSTSEDGCTYCLKNSIAPLFEILHNRIGDKSSGYWGSVKVEDELISAFEKAQAALAGKGEK